MDGPEEVLVGGFVAISGTSWPSGSTDTSFLLILSSLDLHPLFLVCLPLGGIGRLSCLPLQRATLRYKIKLKRRGKKKKKHNTKCPCAGTQQCEAQMPQHRVGRQSGALLLQQWLQLSEPWG